VGWGGGQVVCLGLLTVSQTLVVTHGVLVLDPLPTNAATCGRKCRVYSCQMFVQVGAPRYEFPAQPTLQGLRGTPAHLYGGGRLVKFRHVGCKQKEYIKQLITFVSVMHCAGLVCLWGSRTQKTSLFFL
jgi:hypothetical protein